MPSLIIASYEGIWHGIDNAIVKFKWFLFLIMIVEESNMIHYADMSILPMLKLRRTLSYYVSSVDDYMSRKEYDMSHSSNSDYLFTTAQLLKGKFKHPRALQMQAAAKYGWKLGLNDCYHPEHWMSTISVAQCLEHRKKLSVMDWAMAKKLRISNYCPIIKNKGFW